MDLATMEAFAAYVTEWRAKYNSKQLAALGAKGQAMKNDNGDWSYPIGDEEDLHNAIHAVGRGGADHDKIRKYIIKVAKKLGHSDAIPENWNADGSVRDSGADALGNDPWDQANNNGSCPGCGKAVPAEAIDGEMRCPSCNTYRGDAIDPKGPNVDDGTYSGGGVNGAGVPDATGSISSREPKEARSTQEGDVFDFEVVGKLVGDCINENPILVQLDARAIAQAVTKYVLARAGAHDLAVGAGAGVGQGSKSVGVTGGNDQGTDGTQDTDNMPSAPGGRVDEAGGIGSIASDADSFSDAGSAGPDVDGEDGTAPIGDGTNVGSASTPPAPGNDNNDVNAGAAQREDPNVDEGECLEEGSAYPDEQVGEPEGAHSRSQKRFKARHASTPAPKPEHRARVSGLEIRSTAASGNSLSGQAIVYNTPYTVYDAFGAFTERMSPGVCNGVLAKGDLDCRFLINHDGLPLARTTSGTLELNNGKSGLDIDAHLSPNSTLANDLLDAVKRRDVTQMSVGFRVAEDEWDDDYMNRTVHAFSDLLDVSAVTYPASPTTSIDVAKRMLYSLPVEGRSAVAQAFNIVCDVRTGQRLDNECTNAVLRALEMLYSVDDPRVPLVRVREAWKIARDIRAGKQLSAHNSAFIAAALESLHRADDVDIPNIVRNLQDVDAALDGAQAALSAVSGLPNEDGDGQDWDPVLVKKRELELEQAAERRRRAAKRNKMRISQPPVR